MSDQARNHDGRELVWAHHPKTGARPRQVRRSKLRILARSGWEETADPNNAPQPAPQPRPARSAAAITEEKN